MKFSGTGIFKHIYKDTNRVPKFEERVVVTSATSEKEAKEQIIIEFNDYAFEGIEFIGEISITEILEENTVTEVASSMRIFDGTDEQYLDRFWCDQQPDSCVDRGWKHAWYNKGAGFSACYNCKESREGALW